MNLQKITINIIFVNLVNFLFCNADFITTTTLKPVVECPEKYKEIISVDGKVQCIPYCSKECVNGFCSAFDYCSCFDRYDHSDDPFVCVEKITTTTSTTTSKPTTIKNEPRTELNLVTERYDINVVYPENVTETPQPTTTTQEDIETAGTEFEFEVYLNTEKPSTTEYPLTTEIPNDTTTFIYDAVYTEKEIDFNKTFEKYEVTEISIQCEFNCTNGECVNGACVCSENWYFDNKTQSCVAQKKLNNTENLTDKLNSICGDNDIECHNTFMIIGYVIIGLICGLAILSALIIYLLLRENGNDYNVGKYEKRYGSKSQNRPNNETEMQELPLRNGNDNNYYDADRFLDERKFV